MINTQSVSNFHPLYKDVMELGFDTYSAQQFTAHNKKLEIYLSTDKRMYCPELDGHFKSVTEYVAKGANHPVDPNQMKLNVAFIGVDPNARRKGVASKILRNLCYLADKYNFETHLKIDTTHGTPFKLLKKWCEKNDFCYAGSSKMIRFRQSEREESRKTSLPLTYQVIIGYVCELYKTAAADKEYDAADREGFKESVNVIYGIASKAKINFMEVEILKQNIQAAELLMEDEKMLPLFDEFIHHLVTIRNKAIKKA